jgi:hypothetical protein
MKAYWVVLVDVVSCTSMHSFNWRRACQGEGVVLENSSMHGKHEQR